MARPATYPLIATDATFESGTKDGQATKLDFTSLIEQGFVPGGGDNILAQYLNALFNLTAAWLLSHSQELDALIGAGSINVTVGANQDNYSPSGWQDAVRVHFTGFAGSPVVTGFAAPQAGKPAVKFFTSDATGTLLLAYDTTSTAANRIRFGRQVAGQSLYASIKAGDCGVLVYSPAAQRWFAFVAPAQRTRTATAKTITGGGATNHNVALTEDELNSDAISLTTTTGAATVTGFLMPTNPHYKSGLKLLLIGSAITFNSGDSGSDAGNRLTVTGGNWAAVNGDIALLHEAASGTGWVLHPLKPPGAGGGAAENEIAVTVSADANDWNPGGWQDCTQANVTVTGGPWKLNGLTAPAAGKPRVKRIVVVSGSLLIGYSGPTAANVVNVPRSNSAIPEDALISAGEVATFVYASDNKWHLFLTARPNGYSTADVPTAGTVNALSLGAGYATSGLNIIAGGAGPHVINGIAAPPATALTRGGWKLVRFQIAGTVVHQSVDATTVPDRVIVTSGGSWGFAADDYALLAYDRSAARWILHPLKTVAAGLTPTLSASETVTFDANRREIHNGDPDPSFGIDTTNARDNAEFTRLFPAGSLNSVAFSTAMDPTQTAQYVHDDSGAAYFLWCKFFAGACVAMDFRKVTVLT